LNVEALIISVLLSLISKRYRRLHHLLQRTPTRHRQVISMMTLIVTIQIFPLIWRREIPISLRTL
jgi:hypothetical protein